jgi:hypothetical protein
MEMVTLVRKKSTKRVKKKPTRVAAKKVRRGKSADEVATHYRSLLAILMFLYMLRLIDEKTFNKIKNALYPPRAKKRRRKGKPRRRR